MSPRLILIVEDERLIARDIAMQLQDFGYDTLGPASTGEQAIEMSGRLRPDLVLMDVHLDSAMDGITAAQTIRSLYGIRSIFLSAFNAGATLERAKLAEPFGYLAKPFMEKDLRDVIAAAFTKRKNWALNNMLG